MSVIEETRVGIVELEEIESREFNDENHVHVVHPLDENKSYCGARLRGCCPGHKVVTQEDDSCPKCGTTICVYCRFLLPRRA